MTRLEEHVLRQGRQPPGPRAVLGPHAGGQPDAAALAGCVQCGACTASCGLILQGALIPRRQMSLLALGLHDEMLSEAAAWQCRACNDCSVQCPAGAMPGRVLAVVRQQAVERWARPTWLARAAGTGLGMAVIPAVLGGVLLLTMAVVGSFDRHESRVHYGSLFPHVAVWVVFGSATVFGVAVGVLGSVRAWRDFEVASRGGLAPSRSVREVASAVLRCVVGRRTLGPCGGPRPTTWAHLGLSIGLSGLLAVAGAVAVLAARGGSYPLDLSHPLKLLGNASAVLLIAGSGYFVWRRAVDHRAGVTSNGFDWLLPATLLGCALTGTAAQLLRVWEVPQAAYPVYFIHLVTVLVLLLLWPYTKLAHALYRAVASVHQTATTEVVPRARRSLPADAPAAKLGCPAWLRTEQL